MISFFDAYPSAAVLANRPPVAGPDSYTTSPDILVTIDPLANDADPDNDTVQFVDWLNQPALGNLTNLGAGKLSYTPTGAAGIDLLRYNISDGKLMATGVVNITIGKRQRTRVCLP